MDRALSVAGIDLRGLVLLLGAGVLFGLCAAFGAMSSLAAMFPIVMIFGVLVAIFLLGRPAWIFWLMAATGLFNDKLYVSLGGMNVRAYVALTGLGLGALVIHSLQNRWGRIPDRALRIAIPFAPLFILIGCKLFTWDNISEFPLGMSKSFPLKHLFFASLLYVTGYITAVYLPGGKGLDRAVALWVLLLSGAAVIGFVQIVASNTIPGVEWVHMREVIFYGRAFSVFREPDVFGSVMAAAVATIAPLLIFRVHVLPRNLVWGCMAICSLLLVLLFVRAAWLASVASVIAASILLLRAGRFPSVLPYLRRSIVGSVVCSLVLPLVAPGIVSGLHERVGTIAKPGSDGAADYRMIDISKMWGKVRFEGPIAEGSVPFFFGRGDMSWSYFAPGEVGRFYDTNALRRLKEEGRVSTHPGFCMFLVIAFENGVVGLSMMLLFFGSLYFRAYRVAAHVHDDPDIEWQNRVLGLLLATGLPVLCILVCFQFSYDPGSPFFWVMIAFFVVALDQLKCGSLATSKTPDPSPQLA